MILPFSFFAGNGSKPKLVSGADGDLVIASGQTVNLSSGVTKSYNSITIDAGGTLQINGNTADLTYIGCRNNFVLNGTVIARGTHTTATISGTEPWLSTSLSYTVTQRAGGAGGNGCRYSANGSSGSNQATNTSIGFGGSQNDGHGGGGGGGCANVSTSNSATANGGNGASYPNNGADGQKVNSGDSAGISVAGSGGAGNSSTGAGGNSGTSTSPRRGGNGGTGAGGGGGGAVAKDTGGGAGNVLSGGGGGGGGIKGAHGKCVFFYVEGDITGSGTFNVSGANGTTGGSGGAGVATTGDSFRGSGGGGGGGGGAGGSGGKIWLWHVGSRSGSLNYVYNGGSAGSGGGAGGTTFTFSGAQPQASQNGSTATAGNGGDVTIFQVV